eukprot:12792537-Alexandrium_andersonii.AAC.1
MGPRAVPQAVQWRIPGRLVAAFGGRGVPDCTRMVAGGSWEGYGAGSEQATCRTPRTKPQ